MIGLSVKLLPIHRPLSKAVTEIVDVSECESPTPKLNSAFAPGLSLATPLRALSLGLIP